MIRDAASQRQVDAADPRRSTWLSANAGSGKTRVLTDRVARLLLDGVAPQNILCLTYTKAAAAEMQNRLFARLGGWAMLEDAALSQELTALGSISAADPAQLARARTLFARAIETPGGLKIQTIHAFCASLLRRFPLEAGVSPQFREIEDSETNTLLLEVAESLLAGPHAEVVTGLLAEASGGDLAPLLRAIARREAAFGAGFDAQKLCDLLGIPGAVDLEALCADLFDLSLLGRLAALCREGSSTDQKLAVNLQALLADPPPAEEIPARLEKLFLFQSGAKAFAPKIDSLPTKATQKKDPGLIEEVNALMAAVADSRPLRLGQIAWRRSKALYWFGEVFARAYAARKQALGVLDFDDQISKARALLTDPAVAQWVLFRLDGGIDHVLIDEAQDTSPDQWAVIERLTQEFASGAGASPERQRTVFVVGDKKQSIYSFQGADPAEFDRMQAHFDAAQRAIGQPLQITTLDHSFRSAQAILSVVDAVLAALPQSGPQTGTDPTPSHIAFHEDLPGRVDLWDVITAETGEDAGEAAAAPQWFAPVDSPSPEDEAVILARQIASQISHMITDEEITLWDKDKKALRRRPVRPGDILILVRQRKTLFREVIRACKSAGLPVAGADRLRVGAELAVKDLLALMRFLALPEDDLSLAEALRSPLFGWSEQDLFSLAHHRPAGSYLWAALRSSAHNRTLDILNDLRGQADFLRPYDLIARVLNRHDGRRRLLARLGAEAEDGIDALLAQALDYETAEVPSLTGFLAWMEDDTLEIKRQMDAQGDLIRVMTVHGAKGLEAPVVILPDTAVKPVTLRDEILSDGDQLWWKTRDEDCAAPIADAITALKSKQVAEQDRLLYVAMTRAESWLIIAAAGKVGKPGESWYQQAAAAMETCGAVPARQAGLDLRRLASGDWTAAQLQSTQGTPPPSFDETDPRNIPQQDLAPLPAVTRSGILSPSDLPGAKIIPGPGSETAQDAEEAKARGTLIHRLLEYLPPLPAAQRTAAAHAMAGPDQAATADRALALLAAPKLAHLWEDTALSEVPVTADLPGLGRIHGAIDRLLITDKAVTLIDFKSNRILPRHPEETPAGIINQLAVYAAAIAQIYPDRPVRAQILWTQTGQLMSLPETLLHAALKALAVP